MPARFACYSLALEILQAWQPNHVRKPSVNNLVLKAKEWHRVPAVAIMPGLVWDYGPFLKGIKAGFTSPTEGENNKIAMSYNPVSVVDAKGGQAQSRGK